MRKLQEIIDEAYDIFTLAYDKFEEDKRWKGNYHYEWVKGVAEIAEKLLISERIEAQRTNNYTASYKTKTNTNISSQDKIVTVRVSDGDVKTLDVKERLRELGFWWNRPEGSKDWNKRMKLSDWEALKGQEPFNKLTIDVVYEG